MATRSGDRYDVRIGGDAHGPVVVGRDNRVEAPAAPDTPPESPTESPTQNNTAGGHASLYTVMKGDLHVHHEAADPAD
ncbi:hypothetical protein [Kitasatospora sp. CB01950]|uniref:hypothetical protein n=1 Tax=Kitasatospora sp. CB01950 TaxID=1703930 RepID=UPI00093EAAE3|nr:hypothetical protein [Kitasatospora sp. CB01950]OKJ09170.1 hypothetical protein AMK19_17435 [Kitasatospora sp. CB01950]